MMQVTHDATHGADDTAQLIPWVTHGATCGAGDAQHDSWHGQHMAQLVVQGTHSMTHGAGAVTLSWALRPDIGGWVTLSPRYWAGKPSGTDGGRAPYSAVLNCDPSWSSKLACCLT